MVDNEKDNSYFEPIDVSEPRETRKEKELIREANALYRREWFRAHMTYIFAAVGVIVVAAIVLFIYMYYQNSNPMGQFVRSISKNFGTSFDYEIAVSEDGKDMMHYTGAVELNRSNRTIKALYDADYGRYTYTGAVYSDGNSAQRGSLYQDEWSVHDCYEQVQNFFEFDRSFRSGGFNGGAFLRFTGMTSDYSAKEFEKFFGTLKERLSTDSAIATITSSKNSGGTRYDYDINLYELFSMIQKNGAPVFYRATDYNEFSKAVDEHTSVLQNAKCTLSFFVGVSGYMTQFDMKITVDGTQYGVSCAMNNFGLASVEVPEFLQEPAQP